MKKNTLIIKVPTPVSNASALIKVCDATKDFNPLYGWIISGLSSDASGKVVIDLDREDVLKNIEGLQDTLPFGCTLSVEFPVGTKPMMISDMYHTSMVEALKIIKNSNITVSTNDITDLRIEGDTVIASFRGSNAGEFELYEIQDADNLTNASINKRYYSKIAEGNTRLDITLDHSVASNATILGRWRKEGDVLYSPYITGRQAHLLKAAVIERHEIRGGKIILYIYDRDTLGAFYESGLVIRVKQSASNTNFIVSGISTNLPNRTAIAIDNIDTDRIIGIGGTVDMSVELIGSAITSNTYKFNTDDARTTPTNKYFRLNPSKVVVDTSSPSKGVWLAFESSANAEIEMLQINPGPGTNFNLTVPAGTITSTLINTKPGFGFWANTTNSVDEIWSLGNISYTYRIKGLVNQTDVAQLVAENPNITVKAEYTGNDGKLLIEHSVDIADKQKFIFNNITLYDAGGSAIKTFTGDFELNNNTIELQAAEWTNTAKVTYKYSFAGRPLSRVQETTSIVRK